MLEVKNLKAGYDGVPVIHDASLNVPEGTIVAVLGSNGSGKTTLLRTITGLIPVMSGSIDYRGNSIIGTKTHDLVRMGISMVPEGRALFGKLSVYDNLILGAFLCKDKSEIKRRIEEVFKLLPKVKERAKQQADTLSGGEQQMVAISRGLMAGPDLLILDEPSLGLAPMLVTEIFEFVKRIRDSGKTVILVEQNAIAALEICDYAYVMSSGETIIEGPSEELIGNDQIKKAYLGG